MSKFLQTSVVVHDVRTELVVQPFADRTLVLITQMGKVGHLIQASIPPTTDLFHASAPGQSLPAPLPAIQLTPIFGSAPSAHMQTLYSLYAAQIATLVWLAVGDAPRSIVVGIALQISTGHTEEEELSEEERHAFREVMHALQAMLM